MYGPQKGASPAEVDALAAGLRRWAAVVAAAVGRDWSRAPGAGAAGGVGFAALAVLGATRRPGIELVLDLAGFEGALDGADLVITGEGSLTRRAWRARRRWVWRARRPGTASESSRWPGAAR